VNNQASKTNNYQHQPRKAITVRVAGDVYETLLTISKRRGESISSIVAQMIDENLEQKSAVDGLDLVSAALAKTIRRELKPVEDRMAKLAAKTAIAGATGMYLNYFVIQQALRPKLTKSAKEVYETARVKAVAYLKESGDE